MRFRLVAAVVVAVLASSVRAQTFAPGGHLVVVDANGKVVGQFVPFQNALGVSVVVNGQATVLRVNRQRLFENASLLFEQPNCQGNAYIETPSFLWKSVAFAPDGSSRVASTTIAVTRTYQSLWRDEDQTCLNANAPQTATMLPIEVGPNLKTLFAPPFTLAAGQAQASTATAPMNRPLLLGLLATSLAVLAVLRIRSA